MVGPKRKFLILGLPGSWKRQFWEHLLYVEYRKNFQMSYLKRPNLAPHRPRWLRAGGASAPAVPVLQVSLHVNMRCKIDGRRTKSKNCYVRAGNAPGIVIPDVEAIGYLQ